MSCKTPAGRSTLGEVSSATVGSVMVGITPVLSPGVSMGTPRRVPHREQKFAPSSLTWPHMGHLFHVRVLALGGLRSSHFRGTSPTAREVIRQGQATRPTARGLTVSRRRAIRPPHGSASTWSASIDGFTATTLSGYWRNNLPGTHGKTPRLPQESPETTSSPSSGRDTDSTGPKMVQED